jgi:hypothetical protein
VPRESEALPPAFLDPNPSGIAVGDQLLREFLEAGGARDVFWIRDFLRQKVDLTLFENRYRGGGRPPYHPAVMVGLILYGLHNGLSSLRKLERFARNDIRCWWLTGGIFPDHSKIGDFVNKHAEELSGSFFEDLTRALLAECGSKTERLAGDGTVIQAAGSRLRRIKREAAEQAASESRERARANPNVECLQRDAEAAEEVAQAAREREQTRRNHGKNADSVRVCKTEPEAPIQKQKDGSFAPSWTPSVLANEDRFVVAQEVHPTSETAVLPDMLEQAKRTTEGSPDTLMLDAGYFCTSVVVLTLASGISLLCPQGQSLGGGSWKKKSARYAKSAFEYDTDSDTYECPQGHKLRFLGKSRERERGKPKELAQERPYRRYGGAPCAHCPDRERCTTAKHGRTIKRYDDDELKEALAQVMENPLARSEYRKRIGMVEPVFSSLRDCQCLDRFRRRGLRKVRLEFALHSAAHNLGRALALKARKERQAAETSPSALTAAWLALVFREARDSHRSLQGQLCLPGGRAQDRPRLVA